jgi:UDP-N-acetyl-D-galactosamine dehydrogenase
MGIFVANKLLKLLIVKNHVISNSNVLVLGITFKENCHEIRNSKVIDIVKELLQFNINVDVFDLHADSYEVEKEFGIKLIESINRTYTGFLLALSYDEFLEIDPQRLKNNSSSIIYDIKGFFPHHIVNGRL